jgi:Ca2+-binding EF-hand superfamily protein
VYEIFAEFNSDELGYWNFTDFIKAMDTKPYLNETKKEIGAIFKKYDRKNKGYLKMEDL